MTHSPSYLFRRPSGWYCCINVPVDLRHFFNQSQLRYPLGTRRISSAKHRAMYLATHCRELFHSLRAGDMKSLNEEDIKHLVNQWLQEAMALSEEARVQSGPYSKEIQAEELKDLKRSEQTFRRALGRRNYKALVNEAEGLLQESGYEVDRDSFQFKKLCRELVKAGIAMAQTEQKKAKGKIDGELPALPSVILSGAGDGRSPGLDNTITISELFKAFEKDMIAGKNWRSSTNQAYEAMLNNMVEILGDRTAADLDKAVARDFKAGLLAFPKNRSKHPDYREKSLKEIAAIKNVENISVVTVNHQLDKARGMFKWALDNGYVPINPFEGLSISISKRAKDKVLPFDKADLEKIFGSPLYMENTYLQPYQFWLPLLGLFTGARIEELCQLHLQDLRKVDGIWVFDLNDGPGRELKNDSSKRFIPIHPELIRLGLVKYAETLRKNGEVRLFPELNAVKGKYSHHPSIWFGKLKTRLGFPARQKVFHSFRHRMADMLREVRAEDYLIKRILGHETGTVTHDLYGDSKGLVKPLYSVLKQVDFDVDLSHLKFNQ